MAPRAFADRMRFPLVALVVVALVGAPLAVEAVSVTTSASTPCVYLDVSGELDIDSGCLPPVAARILP